jgi:uncharacterized membrane protein YphA (DoxX/SURF4 family)
MSHGHDVDELPGRAMIGRQLTSGWVLIVPLRIFLAAGWLRASAEKIVDGEWLHGDGVRSFLTSERPLALPFARPVMDNLLHPCAIAVAVVVLVAEVFSGIAIATGRGLRAGLWIGVGLNVAFVACGRVNPSAFYLVMELVLLLALAEGVIGRVPPNRQPLRPVAALLATGLGVALLPFIRTLRPADVIADPAAMLAFLSIIVGLANAVRWAIEQPLGTAAHRLGHWLISWSHAQPAPLPVAVERAALPDMGTTVHSLLRPPAGAEPSAWRAPVRSEGSTV